MDAPKQMDRIGRYQVLERVGKGGMGVLYRGFDPVLDREVAIKLMLTDFSEDTEQMRPRFYREARAAAKLNHRNIVTIFEFAEESNVPYIVMEFLRGTPLGARMSAPPPLSLDDKLNIIAQLCDGLSYAHEQGVVHRDVKPDNVFILEDGSVKLLDFGIAKLTSSNLTRQGDVLGSASYMSPEQVGGSDSVDGRADVFSTGVMLYELLTGHKPFEGDSPTAVILKILKDDPTPLDSYVSGLPPALVAAVTKALAKSPDQRWASADALGRELQSIRKSLPASASVAELDQTRLASTQVMKAIHEDFQKLREAKPAAGTPARPATVVMSAPIEPVAPTPIPPAPSSRLVPALVGAMIVLTIIVAAVAVFVVLRLRQPAPTSETAAVTTDAAQVAAAPAADPTAAPASPAASPDTPAVDPAPAAGAPGAAPTDPAAVVPDPHAAVPVAPVVPAPPVPAAPAPDTAAAHPAPAPVPSPADAAAAGRGAPDPVAAIADTGSVFVDFLNTFSEGAIEVEIDGRKRWSERLGISQQVGGLSKLKLQRVSEQIGTQLKIPAGDHKVTVTILNGDGEVRDFGTTSINVVTARSITLRVRTTRFKNQLQLDTVPGEPATR